jgi:hypothetical protein
MLRPTSEWIVQALLSYKHSYTATLQHGALSCFQLLSTAVKCYWDLRSYINSLQQFLDLIWKNILAGGDTEL